MKIRALWSQAIFGGGFCTKVFPVLKIGQKKCPKSKTQNTFWEKWWISIPY
jgi:hypothetical protein